MNWLIFVSEQWLLVSLLGVLVGALIFVESSKGGKTISFHEATRLVNNDTAIIVDVRAAKDFSEGHITGALNVPFDKVDASLSILEKQKTKTFILVDKMGQHAGAAGKILREKEFDILRLKGGMAEWQGQNLPVVKA